MTYEEQRRARLIAQARLAYERNGLIDTTTALDLNNAGIDVNALEAVFAGEKLPTESKETDTDGEE